MEFDIHIYARTAQPLLDYPSREEALDDLEVTTTIGNNDIGVDIMYNWKNFSELLETFGIRHETQEYLKTKIADSLHGYRFKVNSHVSEVEM